MRSKDLELTFDNFRKCIDKLPENVIIALPVLVSLFLSSVAVEMINYAAATRREINLFTTLVGLTIENFAHIPLTKEYFKLLEVVVNAKKINGNPLVDKMTCQAAPKKNSSIDTGQISHFLEYDRPRRKFAKFRSCNG